MHLYAQAILSLSNADQLEVYGKNAKAFLDTIVQSETRLFVFHVLRIRTCRHEFSRIKIEIKRQVFQTFTD